MKIIVNGYIQKIGEKPISFREHKKITEAIQTFLKSNGFEFGGGTNLVDNEN